MSINKHAKEFLEYLSELIALVIDVVDLKLPPKETARFFDRTQPNVERSVWDIEGLIIRLYLLYKQVCKWV